MQRKWIKNESTIDGTKCDAHIKIPSALTSGWWNVALLNRYYSLLLHLILCDQQKFLLFRCADAVAEHFREFCYLLLSAGYAVFDVRLVDSFRLRSQHKFTVHVCVCVRLCVQELLHSYIFQRIHLICLSSWFPLRCLIRQQCSRECAYNQPKQCEKDE